MTDTPSTTDDFWTHDVALFRGSFAYYRNRMRDVRGKAHLSEEPYSHDSFDPEIVPITTRKGTRTYVMLHPYILDPIMQLTVRLSPYPQSPTEQHNRTGQGKRSRRHTTDPNRQCPSLVLPPGSDTCSLGVLFAA
jgi:hypothetical protein